MLSMTVSSCLLRAVKLQVADQTLISLLELERKFIDNKRSIYIFTVISFTKKRRRKRYEVNGAHQMDIN